ncbi:hypothetical protein [Staphylococcus simulans]
MNKKFTETFEAFSKSCFDLDYPVDVPLKNIELEIQKAKSYAFRDVKNNFVRNENSYYNYFDMRKKQLEIIERIENLLKKRKTEKKNCRL